MIEGMFHVAIVGDSLANSTLYRDEEAALSFQTTWNSNPEMVERYGSARTALVRVIELPDDYNDTPPLV